MSSPSTERKKPTIYQGFRVPFDELAPDEFEDFVRQTLDILGRNHDFRTTRQSGGSSDGGFDINAVRISNPDLKICIQCKRYEKSLSVGHVAHELAKVALKSALEKSIVADQYLVTTAKTTQELDSALRQSGRVLLVSEACSNALSHSDLKNLREKTKLAGEDVQAIVTDYVRNLDRLEVWSGRDFDAKLGTVWSEIQGILDRFFTIHTVLREYPRPDFDEDTYLDQCCRFPDATIPVFCRSAGLPANLELYSAADPRARKQHGTPAYPSTGSSGNASGPTVPMVENLASTSRGSCTILIGPGGGGKTRALESTRAHVAQLRIQDEKAPLPVVIELRDYDGDLDRLVARALGINIGTWRSLPGHFLLLFDGLNELSHENASKLLREIDDLLSPSIAGVIATRDSGFRQRLVLSKIDRVFQLVQFDIRQTRALASQSLGESDLEAFMTEFMRRLATPAASFLLLPFCVAASIAYFEENRTLPENRAALVEAILQRRFKRNNERQLPPSLAGMEIPEDTLRTLAEQIMFAARIDRNTAVLENSNAMVIFKEAIAKACEMNCFGADELNTSKVLDLMCHYEFLTRGSNERRLLPHDLVVGYLAARPLSQVWRSKLPLLASTAATDDAWLFACAHIPREELGEFLVKLSHVDWMLLARAGAETGGIASELAQIALLYLDKQFDTEFRVWEVANALALLGTPACVERLRANAELPRDRSLRSLQNQRALARLGDERFLASILRGETRDNTSVDIHDMWFSAPMHITLRLARQQIDEAPTNPNLRLPLETIKMFGDESDADRVGHLLHFGNESDFNSIAALSMGISQHMFSVHVFRCLYKLTPQLALAKVDEQIRHAEGPLQKYAFMKMLHQVNARVDCEWLLGFMLGEFDTIPDVTNMIEDDNRHFREIRRWDIQEILGSRELSLELQREIVRAYPNADHDTKISLWHFAGTNDIEDFDFHAMNAIRSLDPTEIGCVCLFLERRRLPEAKKQQFMEALIEWIHRPQELGWGWQGYAVVDFLLKNGRTEPAMTIGYGWLRTILDAHRNLRLDQPIEHYCHRNIDIRAKLQQDTPGASTEFLRVWIMALISTLEPVAASIPHEGLDELFHIRLSYAPNRETRHLTSIFKKLDREYVNEKIRVESNSGQRIALLMVLEPLLQFDRLVQVLQEEVAFWIDDPGSLEMVFEVIKSRWDEQLAKVIINIVGQFDSWDPTTDDEHETNEEPETDANPGTDALYFNNKLLIWIGEHLQRDWVERFITPYWERAIHRTSHGILTFWYEMVMHQRNV